MQYAQIKLNIYIALWTLSQSGLQVLQGAYGPLQLGPLKTNTGSYTGEIGMTKKEEEMGKIKSIGEEIK